MKEFADDNFKFDENDRKFSKREDNTVGKGEIAHQEQFLLFPQCFKRLVLWTHKNKGLFEKGLSLGTFGNGFTVNSLQDEKSPPGWLSGERVGLVTWWL